MTSYFSNRKLQAAVAADAAKRCPAFVVCNWAISAEGWYTDLQLLSSGKLKKQSKPYTMSMEIPTNSFPNSIWWHLLRKAHPLVHSRH